MEKNESAELSRGTVSDFHEYVWSLYDAATARRRWLREHPESRDYARYAAEEAARSGMLRMGTLGHQEIEEYRLKKITDWLQQDGRKPGEGWLPEFVDPHDDSPGKIFEAPRLFFDGHPLRGRPDLVFRNESDNKVLIVERKMTRVPMSLIPTDGFLNVKAQLWAYAWMAWWNRLDDADVLLVAEFWSPGLVDSKRTPIRSRNDKKVHKQCQDWLRRYNKEYGEHRSPS